MPGGLRLFGHPVHAAVSHFPLALLAVAPAADAAAWLRADPLFFGIGFWCVIAGLVFAVPTAVSGFLDYAAIPPESAAAKHATWHMSVMFAAVGLAGMGLAFRGGPVPSHDVLLPVLGLEGGAAALLLVGGWLGGELVFGHGLGVRSRPPVPRGEATPRPVSRETDTV